MTSDRFAPLLNAPILPVLSLLALVMLGVYAFAARRRRSGAATPWAPTVLRVLAVLGLVLPGWAIFGWYGELARARELTRSIPIDTAPIAQQFVVNSAALLSVGFLLLVSGIYLARRSA